MRQLELKILRRGCIDSPFPPMLPLISLCDCPRPIVPGRLPKCDSGITLGTSLRPHSDGSWIILPLDCGLWLSRMQIRLREEIQADEKKDIIPLSEGILIALNDSHAAECLDVINSSLFEPLPAWRALNLVCYEVSHDGKRPWSHYMYRREIWRRRLKRAENRANRLS